MCGAEGKAFEYEPLPSMPHPGRLHITNIRNAARLLQEAAAFELSCGHSVQQNTRDSLQSDTLGRYRRM